MAEKNGMLYRCVTRLGRIRKHRSLLFLCVIAGVVFAVWKVGFHGTKQEQDGFQKFERKPKYQFAMADILPQRANNQQAQQGSSQHNMQQLHQLNDQNNVKTLERKKIYQFVRAGSDKDEQESPIDDQLSQQLQQVQDRYQQQLLQRQQNHLQRQEVDEEQQLQEQRLQQQEVLKEQQLQEQKLQQQKERQKLYQQQVQINRKKLQQQNLLRQQSHLQQAMNQLNISQLVLVNTEKNIQQPQQENIQQNIPQAIIQQNIHQPQRENIQQNIQQPHQENIQQNIPLPKQEHIRQNIQQPQQENFQLNIQQPQQENIQQNIQQPQLENIQQNIQQPQQENIKQKIQQSQQENIQQNIQQPQQENIQQNIQQPEQVNIQQNIQQPQQENIQQNIQQPQQENIQQNIQQPQQENIQQNIQQPQQENIQQNIQQPQQVNIQQNTQQPQQVNIQQNIPQPQHENIQQNTIRPQRYNEINDPQNVPQPQQEKIEQNIPQLQQFNNQQMIQQTNNEQFIQQQQHIYNQQNIPQSQQEHIHRNVPQTQQSENPQNIKELQQVNIQQGIQQSQQENIRQNIPQPQQANNQQNIPQLQQFNNLQTIQQEKDRPQEIELLSQRVDIQQETPNRAFGEHEQSVQHQEAVQSEQDIRNISQPLNQVTGQKKFKQISTYWPPPHLKPAPFREKLPVVISWSIPMGMGDHELVCKTRRCLLSHDHEERHKHQVVGILFYGTSFVGDGLPLPREPGHIWSILHEESPKNNDWLFSAKGSMELFNLTATFKRESHYPLTTMWLKGEDELMSTEYVVPLEKKNALRREGLAPVVFVHSDCNTPSDRSHYMKLLQKHLHIDSYGKCEHNKDFPAANMTFDVNMEPLTSPEFFKVVAKYKFAFAFENTVCDDYVTEKFWRPLTLGVVPIVHGSPRIKDLAPTDHSIIDIRDFRSVQEVAEHIMYLDAHDEEYKKYVDFKQTGITNLVLKKVLKERDWGPGTFNGAELNGFQCHICEKVHELQDILVAGQPAPHWQGSHDHYGCPRPKTFDEEGHYVNDNVLWGDQHRFGHYYYKSLQHHINTINDAKFLEIQKYAKDLEEYDKQHNIHPDV